MELEYTTKISIAEGQKFDKDGIIQAKDIRYSLSVSVGPTADIKQLDALKRTIETEIKKSGGQTTLD